MTSAIVKTAIPQCFEAWSAPTSNKDSPINEIAGVMVRGPINRMRNPIVPVAPITT